MSSGFIFIKTALIVCFLLVCGANIEVSHMRRFQSYRLAESHDQAATESALGCATECRSRQTSTGCVAYAWNADTMSCRMQRTLNVEPSDGGTIGIDRKVLFADCSAILASDPSSLSGVYTILVGMRLRQVWCDMDTDGGGWTVFLKRLDGSVDFYLDSTAYKEGFGNVTGEYWLGLDALHLLTSLQTYQLRADISDWEDESVHSLYASVSVADEAANYTLSLGAFVSGTGGEAFNVFRDRQFSAKDVDRDSAANTHCAQDHHGAFWYKACFKVNPTGRYYQGGTYVNDVNDGIEWRTWSKHLAKFYSMKTLDMKIRP